MDNIVFLLIKFYIFFVILFLLGRAFMIINSKCAHKNYLCINQKMNKYDMIVHELNKILELHIKKKQVYN